MGLTPPVTIRDCGMWCVLVRAFAGVGEQFKSMARLGDVRASDG